MLLCFYACEQNSFEETLVQDNPENLPEYSLGKSLNSDHEAYLNLVKESLESDQEELDKIQKKFGTLNFDFTKFHPTATSKLLIIPTGESDAINTQSIIFIHQNSDDESLNIFGLKRKNIENLKLKKNIHKMIKRKNLKIYPKKWLLFYLYTLTPTFMITMIVN